MKGTVKLRPDTYSVLLAADPVSNGFVLHPDNMGKAAVEFAAEHGRLVRRMETLPEEQEVWPTKPIRLTHVWWSAHQIEVSENDHEPKQLTRDHILEVFRK